MKDGIFSGGQGINPAVVWHSGRFVVAWQTWNPPTYLREGRIYLDGSIVNPVQNDAFIGTGAMAFPRLASVGGALLRAARWGDEHGQKIVLERDGVEVWRSPASADGSTWPCVFDSIDGGVWWVAANTRHLWNDDDERDPVVINPTGLAYDSGDVIVTWDENRLSEPGMVCPDRAGAWIVGEPRERDTGVRVRLGAKEALLWPDLKCRQPHCALAPDGTLCVVTHSEPDGLVRWALVTEADLSTPPPPPPPPPTELVFDPHGAPHDWPRVSSQHPGRQMHCVYDGRRTYFVKSTAGVPCEVWEDGPVTPTGFSRLRQDTPGPGRAEGYAYRLRVGRWVPMLPARHVGIRYEYRDHISWLDAPGGTWGPWLPFAYAMTVTRADSDWTEWTYEPGLQTAEHYKVRVGNGWDAWDDPRDADSWPTRGGVAVSPPAVATAYMDAEVVAPTLASPGVTVESYGDRLQTGQTWAVQWTNRSETGTARRVELRPTGADTWSVHCHERNAAGENTSGLTRTVRLVTPSGPAPEPPPVEPPANIHEWRGNFLANGIERWGFMYPGWDSDRRHAFRVAYRAAGYTHLPVGIWGAYGGDPTFDFSTDLMGYRGILRELLDAGIWPCVFVVTDAVSESSTITPANADAFCQSYLAHLRDLVVMTCLGFELNQVVGWRAGDSLQSGHYMGELARSIKRALPNVTVYAHFQPRWWGPHFEGGDERAWYRAYPEIDGLLWQDAHDQPEADVLNLFLTLPGGPHGGGIVGRMTQELGRQCVFFEHSRNAARWDRLVAVVNADGRANGWA